MHKVKFIISSSQRKLISLHDLGSLHCSDQQCTIYSFSPFTISMLKPGGSCCLHWSSEKVRGDQELTKVCWVWSQQRIYFLQRLASLV